MISTKPNAERHTRIGHNGFGLCARWRLEAQKYQTAMNLDRSTALKYSTEPPLAQNPCYMNVCRAWAKEALDCRLFGFCLCGACAMAIKDNVPANCVDNKL